MTAKINFTSMWKFPQPNLQITYSLPDACHHVDPPVGLYSPTQLLTNRDLVQEMLLCLCLALFLLQRFPQVAHVLRSAQLWNTSQQHEGEKSDQQTRVRAQVEVRLGTGVLMEEVREENRKKCNEIGTKGHNLQCVYKDTCTVLLLWKTYSSTPYKSCYIKEIKL